MFSNRYSFSLYPLLHYSMKLSTNHSEMQMFLKEVKSFTMFQKSCRNLAIFQKSCRNLAMFQKSCRNSPKAPWQLMVKQWDNVGTDLCSSGRNDKHVKVAKQLQSWNQQPFFPLYVGISSRRNPIPCFEMEEWAPGGNSWQYFLGRVDPWRSTPPERRITHSCPFDIRFPLL